MICAWKELLAVVPSHLRQDVDRLGKNVAQEIRLRLGKLPTLVLQDKMIRFGRAVTADDLNFVINTACNYSPWTAETMGHGYLTASGGHRIGICGETVENGDDMTGFRSIRSLNIRIARDFPGIALPLGGLSGNLLILGRPGSGKTTLLRDLIRLRSAKETVAVVDERGELFPSGLSTGENTDILTNCGKSHGIDVLLRTMNPDTIAVDEITAEEDCGALLQAGWCGVKVMATAHAAGIHDLHNRKVYRPIWESGLFDSAVVMGIDKSFRIERMRI